MSKTAGNAGEQKRLRIVELPAASEGQVIPWVSKGDLSWQAGEPTFAEADPAGQLSMKGWLAVDDEQILLRLDVRDPVHTNKQTGGDIWNGDFVRVAVDARGDGSGAGAKDTAGLLGPDDASIGFALTPTGPQGWTYAAQAGAMQGAYPAELLDFRRDEAAKLTRYDIRLPWNRFGVQAGAFAQLGIVVQVRDVNSADQNEPTHIRWGDGANEPKPGLFQRVTIGAPPHDLTAVAVQTTEIWGPGDVGRIVAAVASGQPRVIRATVAGEAAELKVEGNGSRVVRRFAVLYAPIDGTGTSASMHAAVEDGGGQVLADATAELVIADAIMGRFYARLDELAATSPHALFTRHLRSVKAMVQAEWAKATLYKHQNQALARETLGYVQQMLAGFNVDAGQWQTYVDGKRALFLAYVSRRDGTLQWYTIVLPKGWDAQKTRDEQPAFPMFMELHGAGNPHYLSWAAAQLGAAGRSANLLGYDRPHTFAMLQRNGYHLFPFGRGNSGYRDIGETDVWEAYDDAHATFRIDEDRQYLYGFSMGGGGTWRLGSRTPDRWAAIAILGMGVRAEGWGQARNVSYLPIWVWGGETDVIAFRGPAAPRQQIETFAADIGKQGGSITWSTTPGVGHNYLGEMQEKSVNWLQQHVRRRPTRFSFVADTDEHRGVWGITMARDLTISATPSFDCTIDGQTVRIDSQGTPRLEVDLGPKGLGMGGDVQLYWNGEKAYEGPVNEPGKPVRLRSAMAE